MVKSYLKFVPQTTFGVVVSPNGQVVYDASGKYAITASLESINVWNIRTGALICTLAEEKLKAEVTKLLLSPDKYHLIAGYSDGAVRVWNLKERKCETILTGHKSAVTALTLNRSGSLLASGSADTNLIVWDVISESGLFRLRGHKDAITDCKFLEKSKNGKEVAGIGGSLISSSKDGQIKVWDLITQHCVQTIVDSQGEVWSFDIDKNEERMVVATGEPVLRIYDLTKKDNTSQSEPAPGSKRKVEETESNEGIVLFGVVPRHTTKERAVEVRFHADGTLLGCLSASKTIDMYHVFSPSSKEVAHKIAKRRRRLAKKQKTNEDGEQQDTTEIVAAPLPIDEFNYFYTLRASQKAKWFAFNPVNHQVLVSLFTNSVELYELVESEDQPTSQNKVSAIEQPGHRSDIRAVAISSNDMMIASASQNLLKIWNASTTNCLRTMESGYGLSVAFVPGNRHVILGTKEGNLELYEISSGELLERQQAHDGAIWSIALRPDKLGIATASADKTVKFFDFQMVSDKSGGKKLTLSPTKTLELPDDALCVTYSPDQKFLAVALLDSTVKVFYEDSLKFFLSLYGHSLPVMGLDISHDNAMIVTGSADKTVKIWGLDFGDCRKSIFAHQDTVMQVKFVPKTHYFFTASKDKLIKYWDGDKFEQIMALEGHKAEIWSLAVSSQGGYIVTGSHDRSLRIWEQTEEQLFLDEERENEMDALFESTLEKESHHFNKDQPESGMAGRRTIETVKAGETLIEALEACIMEKRAWEAYEKDLKAMEKTMSEEEKAEKKKKGLPLLAPPTPSPLLLGMAPPMYLMYVLKRIRPADLEEVLMVLPYNSVLSFFSFLGDFIAAGLSMELVSRICFFLLRLHQNQLSTNPGVLQQTLLALQKSTKTQLQGLKDVIGFNKAAMSYIKRDIELNDTSKVWL